MVSGSREYIKDGNAETPVAVAKCVQRQVVCPCHKNEMVKTSVIQDEWTYMALILRNCRLSCFGVPGKELSKWGSVSP